jgi:exonuclease VII small subunit
VNIIHLSSVRGDEPTAADLAAIEAEMPLIEAEQALLDAEIAALSTGPALSELARRRVRNAEYRVAQVARALATAHPHSEDVA